MARIGTVSATKIEILSSVPFLQDDLLSSELDFCVLAIADRLLPLVKDKEWDVLRIEYWFDTGSLIVYPRNSSAAPYDRLDEYIVASFQDYARRAEEIINSLLPASKEDEELSEITDKMIRATKRCLLRNQEKLWMASAKTRVAVEFFDCDLAQVDAMEIEIAKKGSEYGSE